VAKKKKQGPAGRPSSNKDRRLAASLDEAHGLMQSGDFERAAALLDELDRRYPNTREVVHLLAEVHYDRGDDNRHLEACERLGALAPNDPGIQMMLAHAYLSCVFPFLALDLFRRAVERWPDYEKAAAARQTVAGLEPRVAAFHAELGVPGPEGFELGRQHERVQVFLQQQKYPQAIRAAERLLERWPRFAPALNNAAEASFADGRLAQAVAFTRRALSVAPDNFHALANLARYLFLGGEQAEARDVAERLKAVTSPRADAWVKKAEALSYLGDDQGVLEVWRGGGEGAVSHLLPGRAALLLHLTAVAFARGGEEAEARRLWQRAVAQFPQLEPPRQNLEDLDRPAAERSGPWYYSFRYWLPEEVSRELHATLKGGAKAGGEGALAAEVRRFFERHPEVEALIPALLDRADPNGREFALQLALAARTPALLAALRDFALSQRGTDAMRLRAANVAREAGVLSAGPLRMWGQGKWREVLLLGFEVGFEPFDAHPPAVRRLAAEGYELLQEGDGPGAEEVFRRALGLAPDAPDLLYHLANALRKQGRKEEAEELLRQASARDPDNLFARVAVVRQALDEGDLDRAKDLLSPLLGRRRLHISEFVALAAAQVEYCLARGDPQSAQTWVDMLARMDPDNPNLPPLRRILDSSSGWRRWLPW
jgi:tetratricopeptide (TPR) repeat protein